MYGIFSSISGSFDDDDDDDEKSPCLVEDLTASRELRFRFKDEERGGTWGSW